MHHQGKEIRRSHQERIFDFFTLLARRVPPPGASNTDALYRMLTNAGDMILLAVTASTLVSCGITATPTATPTARPLAACVPATAPGGRRIPAAALDPGLDGLIADFFLAVAFNNETKARGYVVPGLYSDVPNLRQAFRMPASPPGPDMVNSYLDGVQGDSLSVITEVRYGERVIEERVVIEPRASGGWQITCVNPLD